MTSNISIISRNDGALTENSLASVSELRAPEQLTAEVLHNGRPFTEIIQPMTLRLIFHHLSFGRLQFVLRPLERHEMRLDYSFRETRCM